MKRFYKTTGIEQVGNAFRVVLDGRALPTPAKEKMLLPTEQLAQAVADEWDAQGEKIDPLSMPIMTLAATTIDRIKPNLADVQQTVAAYGGSDLLAYWAEGPDSLIKRQHEIWGPHVAWAEKRFAPGLVKTAGIMPIEQPAETLAKLKAEVEALSVFQLSGIADLTQLTGSLVLPLAFVAGDISIGSIIDCVQLDELHQEETWGKDEEATANRVKKAGEIQTAARYLGYLN